MESVEAVLALGSALLLAIGPRGVARRTLPAAGRLLLPAAPRVPVDVAVVVRVEIVPLPGRARTARLGLTGRGVGVGRLAGRARPLGVGPTRDVGRGRGPRVGVGHRRLSLHAGLTRSVDRLALGAHLRAPWARRRRRLVVGIASRGRVVALGARDASDPAATVVDGRRLAAWAFAGFGVELARARAGPGVARPALGVRAPARSVRVPSE